MILQKGVYNSDQVRELQTLLDRLGMDPKGIDGDFGPNTEAAVKQYQLSKGLPPNGVVTEEIMIMLRGKNTDIVSPVATPYSSGFRLGTLSWILLAIAGVILFKKFSSGDDEEGGF